MKQPKQASFVTVLKPAQRQKPKNHALLACLGTLSEMITVTVQSSIARYACFYLGL